MRANAISNLFTNSANAATGSFASARASNANYSFRSDFSSAMSKTSTSERQSVKAARRDSTTVYSESTTSDKLADESVSNNDPVTDDTKATSLDKKDETAIDEDTQSTAASTLTNDWGLRANDILNSPENLENAYQRVSENLALGSMLCGINGFNFMADQFGITPDELYKISNELFAKAKADMIANPDKYPALELEGGASFTFKAATDGSTNDPSAVASNDAEQTASQGANVLLQSDNISGSGDKSGASQTNSNSFASSMLASFIPDTTLELPVTADAMADAQLTREVQQDIVNSMLDNVESMVSAQKSTLRVQLKPEVLGGIEIELTMTSEGISAQMRTNNQQVQALLNTELTQLMDSLRQRGVQINSLDVVYSQLASGDMMFQANDGRNNEGAWSDESNKAALAAARATRRAADTLDIEYATGAYEDLSTYTEDDSEASGVIYDA